MKKNRTLVTAGALAAVMAFGAYGVVDVQASTTAVSDRATVPSADILDREEVDTLLHMTEEEKLAHDVYVALDERWNLYVFGRISLAEAVHLDAMRGLLTTYGLDDPTLGNDLGEFTDPAFDDLYADLVTRGSTSVVEALKVGALIEETDIVDLRRATAATDQVDIDTVYGNLLNGSENHLRAFVRQLDARGVTYEPVLLNDEDLAAILADTPARFDRISERRGSAMAERRGRPA